MELRERVARAILLAEGHPPTRFDEPGFPQWLREATEYKADAAIAAMFEALETPSKGMHKAAQADATVLEEGDHYAIWRAMLAQAKREAGL